MLKSKTVTATVAVKNLEAAKSFYQGKLGLTPGETEKALSFYKALSLRNHYCKAGVDKLVQRSFENT